MLAGEAVDNSSESNDFHSIDRSRHPKWVSVIFATLDVGSGRRKLDTNLKNNRKSSWI